MPSLQKSEYINIVGKNQKNALKAVYYLLFSANGAIAGGLGIRRRNQQHFGVYQALLLGKIKFCEGAFGFWNSRGRCILSV